MVRHLAPRHDDRGNHVGRPRRARRPRGESGRRSSVAARRHRQLLRLHRRGQSRGRAGRGARRERLRRARPWRRPRLTADASSCTTAPTSCSTDGRTRPTPRTITPNPAEHLRLLEAHRRVVRAGGAAPLRAAGGEPVRRLPRHGPGRGGRAWTGSSTAILAGDEAPRVRGPHRLAELHRGRARATRAAAGRAGARRPLPLRELRVVHLVRTGGRGRPPARSRAAPARPCGWRTRALRADRPLYCALSNAKLARRRRAMPPGRTRSAATWRAQAAGSGASLTG